MNPLIEHLTVAAIVLGAFGYLLGGFIRRRRAGKACASGCGCSVGAKPFSTEQK